MSRRTQLTLADATRVLRHLADVAALKAEPARQHQLLIDGLNEFIGTESGFFFTGREWREGGTPAFTSVTPNTGHDGRFLAYMGEFVVQHGMAEDPYGVATVRSSAAAQLWTARDVLPDPDAERRFQPFMDFKRTIALQDGAIGMVRHRGDPGQVAGFALHRFGRSRALSARERSVAQFALAEVQRLIDRGHVALPIIAAGPSLTPRLRQVFERLLAGHAPKSIARELGLSVHTVREYVQRVCAHHGVHSVQELLAKFVRP